MALRLFQSLWRGTGHAVDWLLQNQFLVASTRLVYSPLLEHTLLSPAGAQSMPAHTRTEEHVSLTHTHLVTSTPFLLFSDYLQSHVASPENTTGSSSENLHSTPKPLLSVPRVAMQTW